GQFGDAGGGGGTGFDQAGDGALGEVGYGELMPCLEQVPGHRPAHVTQSYKANFHVVASLLLSGGWACCARRSRRGRRSYTPLWEPCPWAKGCSLGVLCTPFAAGALRLHPSVGALPVGERGVAVGVLCTPFAARALLLDASVGALPAGGRAVPGGVLCTPFAARALLLHPSVGALPVGERAVPVGVLCTPFAAGALLLHPSVGALPVG